MHTFTFCTTVQDVATSLGALSAASFLILDCEGQELGCRGGSLSLLSIGTSNSEIFVYDAVQLDRSALAPVLRLLASPAIMKVVWDGRMDYSEIYHSYGTKLENTLDLQIVEITSRTTRGETEDQRLRRLGKFFSAYALEMFATQYQGIQLVVGMQRCLEEHNLASGDGKDAQVKRMHRQGQSKMWMKRPLPANLLLYASKDIHLISLIYDHFKLQGYMNRLPELLAQSERYVSMHADLALKPPNEDCFRISPVFPLDILEKPCGEMNECKGCHRELSLKCFKTKGNARMRWTLCKACHVVAMRNKGRGSNVKGGWLKKQSK